MDKKEALKKVKNNGWDLYELDDKFKKDKKFVMEMLTKTKDNYVLEHADASLKSDKDLQSQAQKNLG